MIKEKYIFVLHTLRLLGKFLGYLNFLPHFSKQDIITPERVANCHLKFRKHEVPPLDFPNLLRKAIENSRILVTVPWVIEYFSMMDPTMMHLEYIQDSLKILVVIYRWKCSSVKQTFSVQLLRLMVGWLLSILPYPKKYELLLQPSGKDPYIFEDGLDILKVVDKQLMYACCPYLIDFKILVFNFLKDMKYKSEVRKITPLPVTQFKMLAPSRHELDLEMEENFFALHPRSLKKASEFVAERIVSKAMFQLRTKMTDFTLNIVEKVVATDQCRLLCTSSESDINKSQQILNLLDSYNLYLDDYIHCAVTDLIRNMYTETQNISRSLLNLDFNQDMIEFFSRISFRVAVNKMSEWFTKRLQLMISDICSKSSRFSSDTLLSFCDEVSKFIKEDAPTSLHKTLVSLIVELCLNFFVHYPDSCSDALTERFLRLCLSCPKRNTAC
ncbi:codanin-1 [Caerostris extrusa]|uniref:Codanin-1 n=1 Tax=Caerostris extrusa TaxID=172846 RepID=A0AAV4XLC0_CAEEX|nr:codanin-1 [Caerostris extrusa]